VILKNAWQHIEVLQTTDLPTLLNHISEVLSSMLDQREIMGQLLQNIDIYQRQELLIFRYLRDLLKNIEEIGEGR
jgi:hypothetical protein